MPGEMARCRSSNKVLADNPPDAAALAAGYGVGIAKNHPFVDGNKRAAFLAVGMFLYINGMRLQASQAEATVTMLAVAAGDMQKKSLPCGCARTLRRGHELI